MSFNDALVATRSCIAKWPVLAAVCLLVGGVFLGRLFQPSDGGPQSGGALGQDSASAKSEHAGHEQSETTTWTCAMHPQIRSNKPGKCPLCGMKLVPVQTKVTGGLRTLVVSPEARALMNIETAPVERKYVAIEVPMVGKVDFDETKLGYITAWVAGRLDQLYVDFTGVEVNQGDHMVYIYSEQLYAAQEELLQALKYASGASANSTRRNIGNIDLVGSAREKLRLLGLTQKQIDRIEEENSPSSRLTIYSPVSGVVIEKLKQEGERVRLGERIYTVADLSMLWVHLDAYEADLPWIRYGQQVTITTEAYPGEKFQGRIAFIQPVLNDKTRTVKVRVNVPNPDGKLKPEMFVHAVVRPQVAKGGKVMDPDLAGKWISPMHPEIVKDQPGECDICGMPLVRAESLGYVSAETDDAAPPIVIPYSAAMVTGTRAVVYVEDPNAEEPTFDGREIVLGPRAGDYYIVKHGLEVGELVVARGNFKIDAEIQIQAKPSMMTPEGGGGGGGHDHGGGGPKKKGGGKKGGMKMTLSVDFLKQIEALSKAYGQVSGAFKASDLAQITAAFHQFGVVLDQVDLSLLSGHSKMLWKEFAMLLGNDAAEGRDVDQMRDADRVYLMLKNHMRRMRGKLGIPEKKERTVERIQVGAAFQAELAPLWQSYLPLQQALAEDGFDRAMQAIGDFQKAFATVNDQSLPERERAAWDKERAKMIQQIDAMQAASDIESLRVAFAAFSEEIGVFAKSFGFGDVGKVYQLHCPMALDGQGAIWFQNHDETRNPYYGSAMLGCSDRVELISPAVESDL